MSHTSSTISFEAGAEELMSNQVKPLNRGKVLCRALVATRPRRVFSALVILWILNFFDLTYTIIANQIGGFEELNPMARLFLEPSWTLVAFKIGTVLFGSVILWTLRRHRITELVCWLLCLLYTGLAFTWVKYYSILG